MPRIGTVTVPIDSRNLDDYQYALETSTWGSPNVPKDDDPEAPRQGDVLLVATGYERPASRSPRVPFDTYRTDAYFTRVIVVQVTGEPHVSHTPHWPQELQEGQVKYPYRFAIVPIGVIDDLELDSVGDKLAKAFHRSILGGSRAIVVEETGADDIANKAGRPSWDDLIRALPIGAIDIALTNPRGKKPAFSSKRIPTSGQGRQSDSKQNKAIERFAVDAAVAHYESRGWEVTEFGKPFDLLCTRGGEDLRVEVKGTTGEAGTVQVTINEITNARTFSADLFIVHNITLDSYESPETGQVDYIGVGGTSRILPNWEPEDDDLTAKAFQYRVPQDKLLDPDTLG